MFKKMMTSGSEEVWINMDQVRKVYKFSSGRSGIYFNNSVGGKDSIIVDHSVDEIFT